MPLAALVPSLLASMMLKRALMRLSDRVVSLSSPARSSASDRLAR